MNFCVLWPRGRRALSRVADTAAAAAAAVYNLPRELRAAATSLTHGSPRHRRGACCWWDAAADGCVVSPPSPHPHRMPLLYLFHPARTKAILACIKVDLQLYGLLNEYFFSALRGCLNTVLPTEKWVLKFAALPTVWLKIFYSPCSFFNNKNSYKRIICYILNWDRNNCFLLYSTKAKAISDYQAFPTTLWVWEIHKRFFFHQGCFISPNTVLPTNQRILKFYVLLTKVVMLINFFVWIIIFFIYNYFKTKTGFYWRTWADFF